MAHPFKNTTTKSILAEQVLLAKAEKEIQSLIGKINAQLNELLVEELQLKSNAITAEYVITEVVDTKDTKPTKAEIIATFDSQLVNAQLLDASTLDCYKNQMEEDDDDE
ncbi:hypothetical protein Bhyg_17206 [Pseudolycoriella hygida]|uniref:Uncharacterized protein n=1 Tax=Pseudolycoriella hygida TaxID=35572 RepID=A0A9Q0RU64_9DIPT|nr:hypothetical protein Bhyg_17206 [Pseudolycoriella hygida]